MAAPTQQYPPWLTPVPTVVPDANGVPTTSTTILFLPLTYYGPSIPLGPDWTYGGLTPPPSTSTTATVSATPSSITSSSLPLSSSTSSSLPLSSSTSSSLPLSSSTSSSFPVSSSTSLSSSSSVTSPSSSSTVAAPTNTSSPAGGSTLTRGQLIGVIVASVLGFIFLLVLILAAYLFFKGKRRRSGANDRNLGTDYAVVPRQGGGREPGEGSPRHSGEEGDSFLRPSGYTRGARGKASPSGAAYTEVGVKPPVPPKVPRIPAPPATTSNLASSNSSRGTSSNPSQNSKPSVGSSKSEFYGTLLAEDNPARIQNKIGPIREEHEHGMTGGMILTPEQMEQLNDENVLPPGNGEGEYTGAYAYSLLPPPRLVDPATSSPEAALPRPPFGQRQSALSHHSSSVPPDSDENATLLTARRVRVEELGPRSPSDPSPITEESDTSRQSTSFLGAIASRLTWRRSQSPRSSQQRPLLQSSPLSDSDPEQGRLRAPPAVPPMSEVGRMRPGLSTLGLGPDGSRPISSVSGKSQNSGGTIYHDALSSLPGTPSLPPLPRAATHSDIAPGLTPPPSVGPSGFQHRPSVPSHLGQSSTLAPSVQQRAPPQTDSPAATSFSQTFAPNIDILDMPAPSAVSSFGSNSTFSHQASTTSDATIVNHVRPNILQPRLGIIPTPKSWADLSSGTVPSPGSFAGDQDNGVGIGITIDILEEEPPVAGEGWRFMASTSGGEGEGEHHGRRTTFGLPQYVHQQDLTSEQASLYSMRSRLTSSPPRSTGSAPASRRELSYGSNSSRPSARSVSDGSSNLLSFARSGSITSDDRKRGLAHGVPISPALSAFNNHHARNASGSGSDGMVLSRDGSSSGNASAGHGQGHELAVISEDGGLQSPNMAHLAPAREVGGGSAMSSPPMSPLSMPWAGGLDESWNASS